MNDNPTDTIEARVARGAALLDEKLPGWVERIDLDKLKLSSGCNCVLGQTWDGSTDTGYSAFGAHADALALGGDDDIEHGFNAGSGNWFTDADEYTALTAEWKCVVLARRIDRMTTAGAK
jgi:hypothetical protein